MKQVRNMAGNWEKKRNVLIKVGLNLCDKISRKMEFAWIKGVIYNRRLTLCGLQVTGKRETQYKVE